MLNLRIGNGFDAHSFVAERELILAGVSIPHPEGLAGHSDADVLTHAVIDALCGGSGLPDIGMLFPDTDVRFKNIQSLSLLERVFAELTARKIEILNIDSVIICEAPKITSYIPGMKQNLSAVLGGLSPDRIGIKGKTTEGMGFTGRKEGIAVTSVALLCLPD